MKKNKQKICYVAGGSGGHIIPLLTISQQNNATYENSIFFTGNSSLEIDIIKQNKNVRYYVLKLPKLPKQLWQYPQFLLFFSFSFFKSIVVLYKQKITKVISTGSHVSIPVCFAAFFLRIPLELYELNAVPGKTIRLLSRLSTNIFICFSSAQHYLPKKNTFLTHYPIRFTSTELNQHVALKNINFDTKRITLFVLGGSQGSTFINTIMQQWLSHYKSILPIQVIHQSGSHDLPTLKTFYQQHTIQHTLFSFSNNVELYYHAADIIICRAGAGTLFESLFFKKSLIIIPLITSTTDHQVENASAIKKEYPAYCTVLDQHAIEQEITIFYNCLESAITEKYKKIT